MQPSLDRRRHKLVVHYADGRVVKGNTYKLDPKAKGFYIIPLNPSPEDPEPYVNFADLKSVFYVKNFEGGDEEREALEEYVPEGHEVTVEFNDGEVIKGFAFDYTEDSPRFIVDIPDAKDNNYAVLVERAHTRKITLGRVFRVRKLRRLVDSPVKMLLIKYYWEHPGAVITVEALAENIERTINRVRRDIQTFVDEGLMEWVGEPKGGAVKFLPIQDKDVKEFIMNQLRAMKN